MRFDEAADLAEQEFIKPINPNPLTARVKELEEEVKHLKRELAKVNAGHVYPARPAFQLDGQPKEFLPYSKEAQTGRKKKK